MKYEVRYLADDVAIIKDENGERQVTHAEADVYRKQYVSE